MQSDVQQFAIDYTTAWCSQEPMQVAAFYAESGVLQIDDCPPARGRAAIEAAVGQFMSAFTDLRVSMDGLVERGRTVEYHWTLTGTRGGPPGVGEPVRLHGHDDWELDEHGLILRSTGNYHLADPEERRASPLGAR